MNTANTVNTVTEENKNPETIDTEIKELQDIEVIDVIGAIKERTDGIFDKRVTFTKDSYALLKKMAISNENTQDLPEKEAISKIIEDSISLYEELKDIDKKLLKVLRMFQDISVKVNKEQENQERLQEHIKKLINETISAF